MQLFSLEQISFLGRLFSLGQISFLEQLFSLEMSFSLVLISFLVVYSFSFKYFSLVFTISF